MHNRKQSMLRCLWVASSFTLCAGAYAETTFAQYCQLAGSNEPEPVGDRPGHAIQTGEFTCNNVGGGMDGSVTTATYVWEWDKTNVVELVTAGIVRMPGGFQVWERTESTIAVTMADGKVTGVSGTGRGRVLAAGGTLATTGGKTFSYSWKSTSFNQFSASVRVE